ncbi:MAG: protein translocase subunit SecF [Oscillospiraceae bacterium]|nr:protein translocase subunit SecF [Oscillospiraceae bacterium]
MKKEFNVNFYKNRNIYFILSSALIILTLAFSLIFGVNMSIEFQGGALINYSYDGDINLDELSAKIDETIGQEASLNKKTDIASGKNAVEISLASSGGLDTDAQSNLTKTLQETYPDADFELMSSNNVSAATGREFFIKCIVAVVLASALIVIYVAFAFRKIGGFSAGVVSVIALIHDVIMVYATFVIMRYPLDGNFIAVVLTILGYSVNDTIVIFDRIRENELLYGDKWTIEELGNRSLNQVLSRTINISLATVMALIVICVVCILANVSSITTFVIPMAVGMVSGSYSTICLAIPLWIMWKNSSAKRPKKELQNTHRSKRENAVGKIRL